MHAENCTLPGNVVCLVCTCTPGAPSSPWTCRLAFHYPLIRPRLIFPPPPHPRPVFPPYGNCFERRRMEKIGRFHWPIGACRSSWSFERIFLDGMFRAFWNIFLLFLDPSTRNWTIFSSLSLEPRLWIISEDEFCTIAEVY